MKDFELTMEVEQCTNGLVFRIQDEGMEVETNVCYNYEVEKALGKELWKDIHDVMDRCERNKVVVYIGINCAQ